MITASILACAVHFADARAAKIIELPVLAPSGEVVSPIPLGPESSYLEDPAGSLAIGDILTGEYDSKFSPLDSEEPNFKYSQSAFWLKTSLHAPAGGDWLLEVSFPTLDDIMVYLVEPDDGKIIAEYSTGDLRPFKDRPVDHRNFVFPAKIPASGRLDAYIRVMSDGSITVPSYLWDETAFDRYSRDSYVMFGLYFGIIAALLMYNFMLFISLRDINYLYYTVFAGSMIVAQGAWHGLWFEYFWPDSPGWANVAAIAGFDATGMMGAVFSRSFLDTRRAAPRLDKIILLCALFFGLLLVTIPVTPYKLNAIATSITGIIFPVIAITAGVYCAMHGFSSARFFLLAWTILLIGTAALALRNLGTLPTTFFTKYAMMFGSGLEMLFLSFALAERINELRRGKEAAEVEALTARRQMIETLENTQKELKAQVDERTHELTLVNELLLERVRMLKSLAHTDPLTGLANRVLLDERFERAVARAVRHNLHLAVLMIDLDGFKPVNDKYGHETGDLLLKEIAARISNCVREVDTVARLGGDEFVVLLEEMAHPAEAGNVARKIIETVSAEIEIGGRNVRVGASIGASIWPADGDTPAILLKSADTAMYAAKHAGRGRVGYSAGLERVVKEQDQKINPA